MPGPRDGFRSGDALVTFGRDLRILSWNGPAEALTGIPAAEAVGRHCWEVLGGVDEDGSVVCHAGCSGARMALQGRPVASRRLHVRTSGGRRLLSMSTICTLAGEEPVVLHLLRNGPEVAADPDPDPEPSPLTPRQHEVLSLLADGVPAKVVARRLGVAETTVRNHIRAILVELGCHSQLEALAEARRRHLL